MSLDVHWKDYLTDPAWRFLPYSIHHVDQETLISAHSEYIFSDNFLDS